MAVSGPKSGSGGVFADINITPLTDIFLVLLIIFMVTTAVTIESAAHVDLPKAEAAANPDEKPKGVIVTYTARSSDHGELRPASRFRNCRARFTMRWTSRPTRS